MLVSKFQRLGMALSVAACAATFSGCALTQKIELKKEDLAKNSDAMKEANFFDNGETIVDVPEKELGSLAIWAPKNDKLPAIEIPSISTNEHGVLDTIRAIAREHGIVVVIKGSFADANAIYGSSVLEGYSGSFKDAIELMSKIFGFFYEYKKGVLTLYPDQKFVVEMPPAIYTDTFAGMANTIKSLGAFDLYLDKENKTITFRANKNAYDKVLDYLQYIEDNRNMIVYDASIYQVEFTDKDQSGIKWNNFKYTGPDASFSLSGGFSDTVSSATGIGLTYAKGRMAADVLLQFLATQGKVKTVSQPKIMILSGSKGTFRQGRQFAYISKTGTNYSTSVNTVSVETATMKTGLDFTVFGEVSAGSIYSHLALSISDLIKLNNISIQDTTVQLPDIADREVKTEVRCKPGDTIVIGGITIHSETLNKESITGAIPTYGSKEAQKGELVIVLKPRVVKFRATLSPANGSSDAFETKQANNKIEKYIAERGLK